MRLESVIQLSFLAHQKTKKSLQTKSNPIKSSNQSKWFSLSILIAIH